MWRSCSQSARLLEPQDRRQLALPLLLLQQQALLMLPVIRGTASELPLPLRLLRIVWDSEPRRAIVPSLVLLSQHTCRRAPIVKEGHMDISVPREASELPHTMGTAHQLSPKLA